MREKNTGKVDEVLICLKMIKSEINRQTNEQAHHNTDNLVNIHGATLKGGNMPE